MFFWNSIEYYLSCYVSRLLAILQWLVIGASLKELMFLSQKLRFIATLNKAMEPFYFQLLLSLAI